MSITSTILVMRTIKGMAKTSGVYQGKRFGHLRVIDPECRIIQPRHTPGQRYGRHRITAAPGGSFRTSAPKQAYSRGLVRAVLVPAPLETPGQATIWTQPEQLSKPN